MSAFFEAFGILATVLTAMSTVGGTLWLVLTVLETASRVERNRRDSRDALDIAREDRREVGRRLDALEKNANVKK